jgi:hypothetical protein
MRPSQQATGYTALGSTAFVTGFIGVLLVRRLELGLEISALSLLLACLIVAFGVVVSVGVLGVRSELSLSSQGLVYHRLLLGRRWRRKAVPASELLRLLAVSPDGGEPTHLLVRHGQTWLGFPLPGDKAREIAERFGSISPSSGQPPESAEAVKSTEFSQVRTASG